MDLQILITYPFGYMKKHPKANTKYYTQTTLDMFNSKSRTSTNQAPKTETTKNQQVRNQIQPHILRSTSERKMSVDSNLSAKTIRLPLYNVQFYSNERQSVPNGDYIDEIHRFWSKNYSLLQKHHGFIQWIFPNSFKSRFNQKAHPIAPQQIDHFLHNQRIYERYIRTYQMMLQFYGISLKDKRTGELRRSRKPCFQQRYQKTFITSYHNHMRITRILSSLCLLGFARFAQKFASFLKQQIFGQFGALKALQKLKVYERQWAQYQDIDLQSYCQSDYFRKFKDI